MFIKKFFDFLSKFHYDKIFRYSNKLDFDVFIDIGSHQGKIAILMNQIYKNASIYCFEPNKSMNKKLKKIGKNIQICNYAVATISIERGDI